MPSTKLSQIDWVSIAPWTLLLQVPGVALGKPLLIGIVGSLLLGGWPSNLLELVQTDIITAWESDGGFESLSIGYLLAQGPRTWVASILWLIAWFMLGSSIVDHATRMLCQERETTLTRSLIMIPNRFFSLLGGLSLTLGSIVLLAGILWVLSWFGSLALVKPIYEVAWPLMAILLGLPLFLLILGFLVGWPLMLCAVVIDKSDAFDATSRMFAYLFQRLFSLLFYLLIAFAIGTLCHWILATLQLGTQFVLEPFTPSGEISWSNGVLSNLFEGFYFAYFFSASAAVYLMRRKRIDDQPIDEMEV